MKKLILLLTLATVILASCSDDDVDPGTTPTVTVKDLQHIWNLTSNVDYNYKGSTTTLDYIDTLFMGANATLDFRLDNKAYVNLDGFLDTLAYEFINASTLKFDGDVFTINTLTSSACKLTYVERTDTPYYDNVVTLSR